MKATYTFIAVACCLISLNCASVKKNSASTNTLSATELQPIGRYAIDKSLGLEMISSAVHFGFSFQGTECTITASVPDVKGHNYLQYELDGKYQKRIKVAGNSNLPIVITAPNAGTHTVWIYKATEATTGPIFIQKITAKNVKSLKIPSAPLIEFIGNSITCGAAADASEVPCGTGVYHDQHNAYLAYGPRVARALEANFMLSSVSGIGVYRNWNSTEPAMPQVYEKTRLQPGNAQWNFHLFTPKVVSIALGTNDFSRGDGIKKRLPFDSAAFVNAYINFVELVKSKYPKAQIALLSSPMVNGAARITLQNCLTAVKAKVNALHPAGKRVAVFFFQPMQAHGCAGHPTVEEHGVMANEVLPFFKNLLL